MPNKHAVISPSGSEKWINCPGSLVLEGRAKESPLVNDLAVEDETTTIYSAEGSVAHFVAEQCLRNHVNAEEYIGSTVYYWRFPNGEDVVDWGDMLVGASGSAVFVFVVDKIMAKHLQTYLDNLKPYKGDDGVLFPEMRLPIDSITHEPESFGTSDVIILRGDELQVHDLKYGQGKTVDAEENTQLLIYAAGVVEEFNTFLDIKQVSMVIHQPRISEAPSAWTITFEEFKERLAKIEAAANEAHSAMRCESLALLEEKFLTPGGHCTSGFCRARATCPALKTFVKESLEVDFENLDELPKKLDTPNEIEAIAKSLRAVGLIQDWCKEVSLKALNKALAGETVPGYKLAQGRLGNRKWRDTALAEHALQDAQIPFDEVHTQELFSPTKLLEFLKEEEYLDADLSKKLEELIVREAGKPTLVPETSSKPVVEVQKVVDDFEVIN